MILASYLQNIRGAAKKNEINIALIIIPQFLKNNYGEIKKECLKNSSIVSQCVVESTLRKKNLQSIATKLLLQMIAKRGNTLWVPKPTGKISNAMIMAFDNAKGPKGNCLSCCATINDTFSTYFSQFSAYFNNQDRYNSMVKLFVGAISEYVRKNQKPPEEVIVFHNSCSGDQIKVFVDFFLNTLTCKLVDSFGQKMIPRLSLIMVNTKTN